MNHVNNRTFWVDTLKGIAIILVILGHIKNPFSNLIYSFHMPLFFMIAGFFIKTEASFFNFFKKNFNRLMIPFFIFAFIGLGIEIIKRLLLHRETLNIFNEMFSILYWMNHSHLKNTYAFALWFLPTLFVSKLLVQLVLLNVSNIFFRMLIFISFFVLSFNVNLPFAITNALNCILYIYLGSIIFNGLTSINSNLIRLILLAFVFICIYYIYHIYNVPILDMANLYYQNRFLNVFWPACIMIALILSLMLTEKWNLKFCLFSFLGMNTMILFIFHVYTNNVATLLVDKFFNYQYSWALKLTISILLLVLLLLLRKKFKRNFLFKYV